MVKQFINLKPITEWIVWIKNIDLIFFTPETQTLGFANQAAPNMTEMKTTTLRRHQYMVRHRSR